jgi:hypothetical protein
MLDCAPARDGRGDGDGSPERQEARDEAVGRNLLTVVVEDEGALEQLAGLDEIAPDAERPLPLLAEVAVRELDQRRQPVGGREAETQDNGADGPQERSWPPGPHPHGERVEQHQAREEERGDVVCDVDRREPEGGQPEATPAPSFDQHMDRQERPGYQCQCHRLAEHASPVGVEEQVRRPDVRHGRQRRACRRAQHGQSEHVHAERAREQTEAVGRAGGG